IVGGAILGVGIVIAGACPGTVLAQIGTGYKDAIFTFIGGLFGALAFTYMEPNILKPVLTTGSYGKLTLDQLMGVPFPAVATGFAAVIVGFLVWLEKVSPWEKEIGPNADGVPEEPATLPAAAAGAPSH
ncbi:MAG: YeeE/YedE thiosulfate transporter family protein, partial [Rhabdaerophilum sp.]